MMPSLEYPDISPSTAKRAAILSATQEERARVLAICRKYESGSLAVKQIISEICRESK